MPSQSSNLTTLRASGHACNIYVSIMDGTSVLEGELTADPSVASALNVTYTLTAGDAADVYPGMRIMVYSALGDLKGMTSVRFAGSVTSSNLPIREVSWGEIQLVTGDTFIVFNDFLPTDKLPAANSEFSPDHATYTDQTSNPAPIPTSGGHYPCMLPASGSIGIPFVGASAYTLDPDSGGNITHSWFCASGTWDDDTAEDPTLTLTSAGKYLVIHTVTDDDNTKTEVQFIRLRIHDANDPPYEIEGASWNGDDTTGFSCSFKLFENATLSDIPDGIMVCVWAQHFVDGEEVAGFGNIVPSRSHILCTGFLQRDRGSGSDDRGDELEFDVISPLTRYMTLPGFSKALIRGDSPADWSTIKGMTVKRGIAHLFRNYSNIHQLFDVVFSDFDDADYPALYLQKANVWEQVKELADSRGGRVVADMTGRIEIQEKIELSSLLERTALPTVNTIGGFDALSYDVTREHIPMLETYRMRGFKASADTAGTATYLVRFPSSPGRGSASPVTEKAIFDDLSHAFQQVALRGALENRVFFASDGAWYVAPDGSFVLPGLYACCYQFYRDLFYLAVGFANALRDSDMSAAAVRWIPKSVSIEFMDGTLTTTLSAQAETHAPELAGVDDTPTPESQVITEPAITYAFPVSLASADLPDASLLAATDTIAVFTAAGKLHIQTSFLTTPSTTTYDLSATTGTIIQATVDAYSPGYTGTGTAVNAWLLCQTKIVHIADIFGSRTLTVQKASLPINADSYSRMQFERGTRNWGVAILKGTGGGIQSSYALVTQNGANWTSYDLGSSNVSATVHVSPHRAGRAYTVTGAGGTYTGQRSTNYGAAFSALASPAISVGLVPTEMHVPYQSTDDSTVYVGTSVPTARIYRVIGATQTDVSPLNTGSKIGTVAQFGIKTYDGDSDIVLVCGNDSTGGKNSAHLSTDGAGTFTQIATGTGTGGSQIEYWGGNIAGDSASVIYLWGWRILALSTNGGSSFTAKLSLTNDSVVNIMGAPA